MRWHHRDQPTATRRVRRRTAVRITALTCPATNAEHDTLLADDANLEVRVTGMTETAHWLGVRPLSAPTTPSAGAVPPSASATAASNRFHCNPAIRHGHETDCASMTTLRPYRSAQSSPIAPFWPSYG